MESFKQFKTNREFGAMINQPFGWPMENNPVIQLDEAAQKFDDVINDTLTDAEKKVNGRYTLQNKSFGFTVDRRDQAAWKKLFFKDAGTKGVGNGEVALYWLYGGLIGKAQETRGGNDPDLMINKKPVEVKAYKTHNSISLGRFQDRREFRALVNTLFGVANLENAFGGGEGRGQQTFKGELAFLYKDLLSSAQSFLNLKAVIDDNSKALMKFPIFKQMKRTIGQFENGMKAIGYNERKPTANGISVALMKYLIKVSLGEKPGNKGYIANIRPKDIYDVYFHYIDLDNMNDDEKTMTQSGTFAITGGSFKANFGRLFG